MRATRRATSSVRGQPRPETAYYGSTGSMIDGSSGSTERTLLTLRSTTQDSKVAATASEACSSIDRAPAVSVSFRGSSHFTVVAGAKSDVDTLLQLVLSTLPAEAKNFLTIQKTTADISDLTKVWVDATKASWRTSPSTYAMIGDEDLTNDGDSVPGVVRGGARGPEQCLPGATGYSRR